MAVSKSEWGWGLVGPGRFAREFTEELQTVERVRLAAVASRSADRAEEFARDFGFERSYGSYDKLLADPGVDVVYIALPHVFHREMAERALQAGKAVVCEKPLTPSLKESEQLVALAKDKGIFFTEAMKTAFLPAIQQAKTWIDDGAIGEVTLLKADFGFPGTDDLSDRTLNPDLGGGCLHDIGIYPLFLSLFLLGDIDQLKAVGHLAESGVEDTVVLSVSHTSRACAALSASFRTPENLDAVIVGTRGKIRLPKFHAGTEAELLPDEGENVVFKDRRGGLVLAEIEGICDALDQGLLECPQYPHALTLDLARWMDEALHQLR